MDEGGSGSREACCVCAGIASGEKEAIGGEEDIGGGTGTGEGATSVGGAGGAMDAGSGVADGGDGLCDIGNRPVPVDWATPLGNDCVELGTMGATGSIGSGGGA